MANRIATVTETRRFDGEPVFYLKDLISGLTCEVASVTQAVGVIKTRYACAVESYYQKSGLYVGPRVWAIR